ncbi:MAG: hypothetical protein J07HN6_00898 [Halonotius sp. J07HN6]|jgi:hypothetical protein|nr:MAG: hypothetical protein J07HN6_00898 [Halonotius sp. J07HN6]
MLHTVADDATDLSAAGLQAAYETRLQEILDTVGIETADTETDLDRDTLAGVADGEAAELTLTEAAAIAALDDEFPDAEAIVLETRDHLLMGMTTAVLDVDAIAANLDVGLTGQEVQQAIEGRVEMTLAELAAIQSVIEQRLEE